MRPTSLLIAIVVVVMLLALAMLPSSYAQPIPGSKAQYLPLVFSGLSSLSLTQTSVAGQNSATQTSIAGQRSPTVAGSSTAALALPTIIVPTVPPVTPGVPAPALRNGGFEDGKSGWGSIEAGNEIIRTTLPNAIQPQGGVWAA